MEPEQGQQGQAPPAVPADFRLRASDPKPFRAAPAPAGKLLEPLAAGADSDQSWSAIGGQLDGCDSDTLSVSQELDSCDSDTSSVSQESDSWDDDTSSVSNDSEYSHTLDRMNVSNRSLLEETTGEESESESEDEPLPIPVQISVNRQPRELEARTRTITTVNNNPRIQESSYLPAMGVTNYRSLGPKIKKCYQRHFRT